MSYRKGSRGNMRADALATIDRHYDCNTLIVADLTFDRSYTEVLFEIFGARMIGVRISSNGDRMTF